MNKIIGILLLTSAAMSLFGCRAGRKAARNREVVVKDTIVVAATPAVPPAGTDTVAMLPGAPGISAEKQQLISSLLPLRDRGLDFTFFSGKAKVHYEGRGEKHDFAANIRMEQGKRIWVSITALGLVEVARLLITPDSIMLINRLKKEAQVLPFSEAGKLLPVAVDFPTLQHLIIGNALRTGGEPTDATDFGGGLSLVISANEFQQQLSFNKTDSTLRQQQLRSTAAEGPSLLIQYGDYGPVAGRRFAAQRVLNVQDKGQELYMDMEFNSVEFDKPVEFSFSIPEKYMRK